RRGGDSADPAKSPRKRGKQGFWPIPPEWTLWAGRIPAGGLDRDELNYPVVPTEAERSSAQWRDLVSTIRRCLLKRGPSAARLRRSGRDDGIRSDVIAL